MATTTKELPGNRSASEQSYQGYVRRERPDFGKFKQTGNERTASGLKMEPGRHQKNHGKFLADKNHSLLNLKDDESVIDNRDFSKIVSGIDSKAKGQFYLARRKQKHENLLEVNKSLSSSTLCEQIAESSKTPQQTWAYYRNMKGGHSTVSKDTRVAEKSKLDRSQSQGTSTGAVLDSDNQQTSTEKINRAETMLRAFGWVHDYVTSYTS